MATTVKNQAGVEYGQYVAMEIIHCCSCGVPFAMPESLRSQFQDDPKRYFYCPNGHPQHYSKSTEQRLRETLQAEKDAATKEQQRLEAIAFRAKEEAQGWQTQWENQLKEKKKIAAKLKRTEKRIAHGVCPCCNRTFQDLARHMETKHPEQVKKAKA